MTKSTFNQIFFICLALLCVLFFQHTDGVYTLIESFSYLNGHVLDFYDFNSQKYGITPYFPTIYAILSSWYFPLDLLNILDINYFQDWASTTSTRLVDPKKYFLLIVWYKILLLMFTYLSFKYLKKIANQIKNNTVKNEIYFITSPILFFSILVFGGYDILGIFFIILGFYFYIRNDLTKFSIAFSFAISAKFFALIIFIPLLLLKEKSILKIFKHLILGASVCLISIFVYVKDPSFFSNVFNVASDKIKNSHGQILLLLLYFVICFICFMKKSSSKRELIKSATFAGYTSILFLFFWVKWWHPHWAIYALPFMVLSYSYIKNKILILYAEILGISSFFIIMVNSWKDNLDQKMLMHGALSYLFDNIYYLRVSDILNIHILDYYNIHLKTFCLLFVYLYLLHPILIYALENNHLKKIFKKWNY